MLNAQPRRPTDTRPSARSADQASPSPTRLALPKESRSGPEGKARLRALVDEYHAFVWRSLRRLGVPAGNVDDAVQQVYLVASRRLGEIEQGRERAFLLGTAVRVAANARRDCSRRAEVLAGDAIEEVPCSKATASEALHAKSDRELLEDVLAPLPLELLTVFVLFEFEEMTAAEVAATLDLPPGTVASRIRRARDLVERQIRRVRARIAFGGGGR